MVAAGYEYIVDGWYAALRIVFKFKYSGVHLPDGHFVRIPHETAYGMLHETAYGMLHTIGRDDDHQEDTTHFT